MLSDCRVRALVFKQIAEEKARREKEREEFKKAQELESLRRCFKRIDKNGDGSIDCDELTQEVCGVAAQHLFMLLLFFSRARLTLACYFGSS